MRPLDPRLLRYARSARAYVILTTVLGLVVAVLVVAQALLIARILAPAVSGTLGPSPLVAVAGLVGLLAAVVAARALATWTQERFALRAAARTIAELRESVVQHAARLGPRWIASGRGPEVATLATRGLDDLEPYLVRYLPQLLLAATVTPLGILVVFGLDWVSAVIIVVTIPLVPIFMILVGHLTAGAAARRLAVVQRLGSQVLDLLTGLPTLRAFGREIGPQARVRALGEANRRATMGTLRIAFLSGMVLELLTTLSVAVVAVGIGLRLLRGEGIDLEAGLAVLILAPEVYLPLRQVGAQFHASTDGLAAAEQAFEVLETPARPRGTAPCPPLRGSTVAVEGVSVRAGDRAATAPADLSFSFTVPDDGSRGRVVALTGPSGSGKSTAALVLLALHDPDEGRVSVRAADGSVVDLRDLDPRTWWSQITWVPQRPALAPGRLRDVVRDEREARDEDVERAARLSGLDAVVASLPDGWDTVVGRGGSGLSVGQRQRVALAQALLDDPARSPVVVLDEPTAHLDARGEQAVLESVRAWRDAGRTVLVVAHRASLVALADDVVSVWSQVTEPAGRTAGPASRNAPTGATEPSGPAGSGPVPANGTSA
ncbi:thiol reductant ABC exporter subunit CydD [Paraoerskovia sediminicola]|uniref:Thiol reductant ABC exporter subunit CydD n=1 Tax=Paraoerskovia sediminicola TaxID=1138587 RepID=A0ABM8G4Y8_9CELL|nr:thiol reductant ABC exporter subunit CydD [Paraoerskovia sediminicola]BDZ43115.1 thiol reductant ABC exporter subunit CydD [Paraoerskovia sediminicola]